MNTEAIAAKLEDYLIAQGRLAGDSPMVDQVVEALVTSLEPALKQAVLDLTEQAAIEIGAQLPAGRVEVVLSDGEPTLMLRSETTPEASFNADELEARMTVRLPSNLKAVLEEAADDAGDSVNSYVIKTLASGATRSRKGSRIRETLET
jgi:hypothetical protein